MKLIYRLALPALAAVLSALALVSPDTQAGAQHNPSAVTLTIKAPPQTVVWIDSLRFGAVPAEGELRIKSLPAGPHTLRARLKGKREVAQTVSVTVGGEQTIQLAFAAPADAAELHFQTAEELREQSKHAEAIKEYRAAIKLKPRGFAAAHLGLARSLMATEEFDDAIAEVRRAMRDKPGPYPEAHTVIGNTKRSQGFYEEAIVSYRTALAQAHNISPEAHTGMALAYQEIVHPEDAIKHFQLAAAQANDTEPVIYFLLGSALERERRNKEALAAYDKYLELQPNGSQAAAVRSVLKRLRRDAK